MPKSGNDQQTYKIGALAAEFGLTLRTIRFYEDEGLLTPTRAGTARIYSRRDRGRLQLICRGKRLGFSVAEIKQFLDLYQLDNCQVEQMRYLLQHTRDRVARLRQQAVDVQQTIAELEKVERDIVAHLEKANKELSS
jgi:DNA-binding transcriptional MerR regulator